MNKSNTVPAYIFRILTLTSILLLTSTNSLAEVNQTEKLYAQKGYPYEGLVARSEEITIIYTERADNVSCRVEVSQNGQIWQGEKRSTSLKKFAQKPLRACLDRTDAKQLLANTF